MFFGSSCKACVVLIFPAPLPPGRKMEGRQQVRITRTDICAVKFLRFFCTNIIFLSSLFSLFMAFKILVTLLFFPNQTDFLRDFNLLYFHVFLASIVFPPRFSGLTICGTRPPGRWARHMTKHRFRTLSGKMGPSSGVCIPYRIPLVK